MAGRVWWLGSVLSMAPDNPGFPVLADIPIVPLTGATQSIIPVLRKGPLDTLEAADQQPANRDADLGRSKAHAIVATVARGHSDLWFLEATYS